MLAPKTGGFSWDPENRERVKSITQDLKGFGSDGKPPSMSELFSLCVVFGWNHGYRKPVRAVNGQVKENNVPYKYFREEDFNLLIAVSLAEAEDSQILLEESKSFKILEEYAAGGLSLLVKAQEENEKLEVWLETEFVKFIKSNPISRTEGSPGS